LRLDIEISEEGVVCIKGDANIYSVNELKDKLLEIYETSKEIKIDLSEVSDIDTSAIQALLSLKMSAKKNNIPYKILNPSEVVVLAFKYCGILRK
jgi:anti-anti-sigma factor